MPRPPPGPTPSELAPKPATPAALRSSFARLTGEPTCEAPTAGAGDGIIKAQEERLVVSLLRWLGAASVGAAVSAGLWSGARSGYFGVSACTGQLSELEGASRHSIHEFIGWAPGWARGAVLVFGVLLCCRKTADIENNTRGALATVLLGAGEHDGEARAAGWDAIVVAAGGQSTYAEAMESRGLTPRQAFVSSVAKLVLWHWSQPCAYMWLLYAYRCYVLSLGQTQQNLAAAIAGREVLYFLSTVAAAWFCPVFLLLDLRTVWSEDTSRLQRVLRVAMYALCPHNYVALSLAGCFPSWRRLFLCLAAVQVLADLSSCFALVTLVAASLNGEAGSSDNATPLKIGAPWRTVPQQWPALPFLDRLVSYCVRAAE